MKISLWDEEFRHLGPDGCYTGFEKPKNLQWDRDNYNNDIIVYTERCYHKAIEAPKGKINIFWPLEPASIHKYAYDEILGYKGRVDYVFCFDYNYRDLFMTHGIKSIAWSPGGSYLYAKDWQVYPKTKNLQIIASKKDWTVGHRLRHEVIAKHSKQIDSIYGRAYKYYDYQLEPFRDHRFAIVIENEIIPDYWTDKLLDCFLTGTVPVVWNDGFIESYFNRDGMILWKNIDELPEILDTLNDTLYNKMMLAVQENFNTAKNLYGIVEDYLYMNFFKQFDK